MLSHMKILIPQVQVSSCHVKSLSRRPKGAKERSHSQIIEEEKDQSQIGTSCVVLSLPNRHTHTPLILIADVFDPIIHSKEPQYSATLYRSICTEVFRNGPTAPSAGKAREQQLVFLGLTVLKLFGCCRERRFSICLSVQTNTNIVTLWWGV